MERRNFLVGTGVMAMTAVAGCSGDGTDDEETGDGTDDEETVVFHEIELTSDTIDDALLKGEATNELGSEKSISLDATFYDDNGTLIDSGLTYFAADIPDGQRFRFEIDSGVAYAEVADYDLEWEAR